MPGSKKITIKTKITVNTISDDIDTRDNATRELSQPHSTQSHLSSTTSRDNNRSILNDVNQEQHNGSGSQRQFFKRQSRRKKASSDNSNNVESISLQETNNENRHTSLKASFLRRKIKEYEGKMIASF